MADAQADATLSLTMQAKDEAEGPVSAVMDHLEGLRTAIGGIGIATAAIMIEAADSFQEYGLQVERVGTLTNSTTQDAARLISGFEGAGLSADAAQSLIQRLEMRLGTLGAEQAKAAAEHKKSSTALDELGIKAKDAHGNMLPMTDMIPLLIDRLKGIENPAERARIATQLFGRNWSQLLPMIEQGGQAFRNAAADADRFGLALSPAQVEAAHRAEIANARLAEAVQGLNVIFGQQSLPVLIMIKTTVTDLIGTFIQLGPAVTTPVAVMGLLIGIMGPLIGGVDAVAALLANFAQFLPGLGEKIEQIGLKFLGLLGPIGLIVAAILVTVEAFQRIGIVHVALIQLVDGLRGAFENLNRGVSGLHGPWATLQGLAEGLVRTFGGTQTQIDGVHQALLSIHGSLDAVLQPLGRWNDALLKGEDPARAWTTLVHTMASRLTAIHSPLAVVAQALSVFNDVMRTSHDIGLAVAAVIVTLTGNAHAAGQAMLAINGAIDHARSAFATISGAVHTFFSTLQQTHSWLIALTLALQRLGVPIDATAAVVRFFRDALALVGSEIRRIVDSVLPPLSTALARLEPAFSNFRPLLAQLQQAWTQLEPVLSALEIPLLGVAALLVALGVVIAALLGGVFNALISGLTSILPAAINAAVAALNIIMAVFQLVATIVTGVVAIIAALIRGDWAGAWEAAKMMVVNAAHEIGTILYNLWMLVGAILQGTIGTIFAMLGGLLSGIIGAFMNLYHALVGGSIIPDLILAIAAWFASLPGRVMGVLWGLVGAAIGAAESLASGMFDSITGVLGGLGGAIGGIIGGAIDALGGFIGWAGSIGSNIGWAIINGVMGALGNLGGRVSGAVRGALSNIPDVGGVLSALGLQEGGIVTRPTYALIGERPGSAEAVMPLDRLPSLMAQAMAQVGMMAGGGGSGRHEIVLKIDSKELTRVVLDQAGGRWKLLGGYLGSGA